MNRIDPDLFAACFSSWVAECWPDEPKLIAIDGKTSRRSHDRKAGQKALHLVSAFATTSRLVLSQEAVDEKSNETTSIPALLERIDVEGALVSIDAIGCNPTIAQTILDDAHRTGQRRPDVLSESRMGAPMRSTTTPRRGYAGGYARSSQLRKRNAGTRLQSWQYGGKAPGQTGMVPTWGSPRKVRVRCSLVAHLVRDEGVAGSNPATPTSTQPIY